MSNGNIGLTFVLQDFDLINPAHAAWVSGRMIHRVEHFMQVGWLTCASFARDEVALTWPVLRVACRGLFESEQSRIDMQQIVDECEQFWGSQFGTEWHAELVLQCNDQIDINRRDGVSERELIETRCGQLLFSVTDLIATLRKSFANAIGNELFQYLCLAESLEQVVSPLPVYRFMVITGETVRENLGWNAPVMPRSNVSEMPRLPVRAEPFTRVHWNEISMRWQQLRLPNHILPGYLECAEITGPDLIRMIESRFRAAILTQSRSPDSGASSHQAVSSPINRGGNGPDSDGSRTRHHLGLRLEGRLLYRESTTSPVELESSLQMGLIREFIACGRNLRSLDYLQENWVDLGGNERDPEETTVRSQISRLRGPLARLGVAIENIRGEGWYLAHASDE